MNWQIFWLAFSTIFLAEIADKTQFGVLGLVSKTKQPLAVLLGTMTAFLLVTLIAVVFGEVITKFFPPNIMRLVSGATFIIVGILIFWGRL